MSRLSGYFMEPQNFSVNDGEGIRTIIFFAGCPLRCQWCANPESSVGFSTNILNHNVSKEDHTNYLVHKYHIDELLEVIEKQKLFYRFSGGGVTFSGGEPTLQKDMLRELTYKLYDKAIDLAIETSGFFDFDEMKDVLEKLNLIFIDLKHMDDEKHKYFIGVSNKKILKNIARLNELEVPVVVRIPVIESVNSDEENIRRTASFLKENLKNPKLELLPYHSFGDEKYGALGLEVPSRKFAAPSLESMEKFKEIILNEGVELVSYR